MKASEFIKTLSHLIENYGDHEVTDANGISYSVLEMQEDFLEDEVRFVPLKFDTTNPKVCMNESE